MRHLLARVACVIAIAIFACQTASAAQFFMACSLSRLDDIALYTSVVYLDLHPFTSSDPFGDDLWYNQQISGTDEGTEQHRITTLTWYAPEEDDTLWYQLPVNGGCDTPSIYGETALTQLRASATGETMCWPSLKKCYLRVLVSNGSYDANGDPSGYYPCGGCVPLVANPKPDWCFDGWSGDVVSYYSSVEVCMNGGDKTVTANFSYCPAPCDPNTDPNCPPATCDPWTPECGNDPGIIGNPVNSPIVVNFERGGYRLSGKESPVLFDIQASGTPIRIGWTAAGADEAFLCLDRNGSGRIDDGSELFGTATRLKNGLRAPNGFAALAEYDDNHDGVIDEFDQIWSHLLLWRDLNHDGISQPSELTPVAGSDLTSISLDCHWTGRRDAMGNTFRYEAKAWLGRNKETATPEPVYDIFFVPVP